jgi:hypothetical protein
MNPIMATVQEFKAFLADMKALHGSIKISTGAGVFIKIKVDGVSPTLDIELGLIADATKVSVCGYVTLGGVHYDSLQRLYKSWQKGLMTVTCTARIPREQFTVFCDAVKGMGGMVVSNNA